MVSRAPVFLFMKGSPDAPLCGFSWRVVATLLERDSAFDHFDVLTDDSIREGIKNYSDWPTIPQLYVNGEFVGGCEIVEEMAESGELDQLLSTADPQP
jgi:Grx4 family monothiol glutaredoxin